jgi:hypothetical protein
MRLIKTFLFGFWCILSVQTLQAQEQDYEVLLNQATSAASKTDFVSKAKWMDVRKAFFQAEPGHYYAVLHLYDTQKCGRSELNARGLDSTNASGKVIISMKENFAVSGTVAGMVIYGEKPADSKKQGVRIETLCKGRIYLYERKPK